MRPMFMWLAFLVFYWCLSGIVLWWSYDISSLIRGGYYQRNQALALVAEMGLIITALVTIVWLLVRRRKTGGSPARLVWKVTWRTWLLLVIYAAAVFASVQFGHGKVPLNDSAFLPVLGHVNSHFFSEAGWLTFLLNVIPIMGCISGVLFYLQIRVLGPSNLTPS